MLFVSFLQKSALARGWAMVDVSRKAKLSLPELSRIYSGTRPPSLRIIEHLADAFSETASREGEPYNYAGWAGIMVQLARDDRLSA